MNCARLRAYGLDGSKGLEVSGVPTERAAPKGPTWGRRDAGAGAGSPCASWATRRTASTRAARSSPEGGAGSKFVARRTTCHPSGAVRFCACSSHRSYELGSATVARGPTTTVEQPGFEQWRWAITSLRVRHSVPAWPTPAHHAPTLRRCFPRAATSRAATATVAVLVVPSFSRERRLGGHDEKTSI